MVSPLIPVRVIPAFVGACVLCVGSSAQPPVVDPPQPSPQPPPQPPPQPEPFPQPQPGQGPEQPREGIPEFGLPEPPAPDDQPAAGEAPPEPDQSKNLLKNPSFEDGVEPWFSFDTRNPISWGPFSVSDAMPRTGKSSVLLSLDSSTRKGPTCILGAIQEFPCERPPETISGWYRVDAWERATPKQYLQVVVILWNVRQPIPNVRGASNVQIAYTLAGVDAAPLSISNRKFVLAGPPEPVLSEWVRFEVHPRKDFLEHWKVDFNQFEYCRVLFEVRYDGLEKDAPAPARATVYYDDLYAGE